MASFYLIFLLNSSPVLAISTPLEVQEVVILNARAAFEWMHEYIISVIGLTLATSLIGYWIKTWR